MKFRTLFTLFATVLLTGYATAKASNNGQENQSAKNAYLAEILNSSLDTISQESDQNENIEKSATFEVILQLNGEQFKTRCCARGTLCGDECK